MKSEKRNQVRILWEGEGGKQFINNETMEKVKLLFWRVQRP
jgi:hypothetical protein